MVKGHKFNSVNIKSKEFREFRNHMKKQFATREEYMQ